MAICPPVLGWGWEQEGSWSPQAAPLRFRAGSWGSTDISASRWHRVQFLLGMAVMLAVPQPGSTTPRAGISPRGSQPASSRMSTGCAVLGTCHVRQCQQVGCSRREPGRPPRSQHCCSVVTASDHPAAGLLSRRWGGPANSSLHAQSISSIAPPRLEPHLSAGQQSALAQ